MRRWNRFVVSGITAIATLNMTAMSAFAGSLTVSAPTSVSFPALTLDGQPQVDRTNLSPVSIADTTGSGTGYHLTVQASQVIENGGKGYPLPKGSVTLNAPTVSMQDSNGLPLDSPNVLSNGGFETSTGTAQVLQDNLQTASGWNTVSGSFSYSSSGTQVTSGVTYAQEVYTPDSWSATGTGPVTITDSFQTDASTPDDILLGFYKDANDSYIVRWQGDNNFVIYRTGPSIYTALAADGATYHQSPNTEYTMSLSITQSGQITAKLYLGNSTHGTLEVTISATDTNLQGPFQDEIGANQTVILNGATVNAPWADNGVPPTF